MKTEAIRQLLDEVRQGLVTTDEAMNRLRDLPFADLGHTKLDLHRELRRGQPEAIFCAGKTIEQLLAIVRRMAESGQNILMTRVTDAQREALVATFPDAPLEVHDAARLVFWCQKAVPRKTGRVAVVCAGTSDIPVADEAAITARAFGSPTDCLYDLGVAGIHRILAHRSVLDAARVLVVVAGMEGALASVVGGMVRVPVIAVPTSIGYGASFHGLAALLAMLNSCSPGVSVVNIDNGYGAGCLADMINGLAEPAVSMEKKADSA